MQQTLLLFSSKLYLQGLRVLKPAMFFLFLPHIFGYFSELVQFLISRAVSDILEYFTSSRYNYMLVIDGFFNCLTMQVVRDITDSHQSIHYFLDVILKAPWSPWEWVFGLIVVGRMIRMMACQKTLSSYTLFYLTNHKLGCYPQRIVLCGL